MKQSDSSPHISTDPQPAKHGPAGKILDWTARAQQHLGFAAAAMLRWPDLAARHARRKPRAAAAKHATEVAERGGSTFAFLAGHRKRNDAGEPLLAGQANRPPKAAAPPMTPTEREVAELHGDSPAAMARRRERARCEAIITSSEGQANPVLARMLAFEGRLPRSEAIALMRRLSGGSDFDHLAKTSSARPMPVRHLGARNGGAADPDTMAASWDRALQRGAGRPSH